MDASPYHRAWPLVLTVAVTCGGCVRPQTRPTSDVSREMAMEKAGPPQLAPSLQINDPSAATAAAKAKRPTQTAANPPADYAVIQASGQLPELPPVAAAAVVPPPPGSAASDVPTAPLAGIPPAPLPGNASAEPLAPITRAQAEGLLPQPKDPFPLPGSFAQAPAAPPDRAPPSLSPGTGPEILPALAPAALAQAGQGTTLQTSRLQPVPAAPDAPRALSSQVLKGTPVPRPDGPAGSIAALYRLAAERYAGMDSYIVRLTRREQVAGKNHPEEIILLKARRVPWSIYLKWVGGEGKGREVVYVHGHFGDKVHLRTTAGDLPLSPAGGGRLSVPLDNPLAQAHSRHPITEAGFGRLIEHFGLLADAVERGDLRVGSVKYLGILKRFEFEQPVEAVLHAIPPGTEPALPRGGQRWWFFDAAQHLPILVVTHDDRNQEVEYYCYDHLLLPASRLPDDEFNPDVLWKK
jgi:hypothetical protein